MSFSRSLALSCACLVALFALTSPLFADGGDAGWVAVDDDEGVKVWKNEKPGQELPGFRGEVVIDASLDRIVSILQDNPSHTKWMYRCRESTILKRLNADEAIVYNRTESPWPVWDRDVILSTKFSYNGDRSELTLEFHEVASDLRALPDKVVRMPHLSGFYKLWRLDAGKTRVRYQVEADVGGSIPRWLAARVSKELPFHTLSRLRDRAIGQR